MAGAGHGVRENVRTALRVVAAHKLRSGLVVLGVAIGVATLMGMVSVVTGIKTQLARDVTSSDNVVVRLAKVGILVHGERAAWKRRDVTDRDWRAIRDELASVRSALFLRDPGGPRWIAHYRDQKTNLLPVLASSEELPRIYNIPIETGRYFGNEDVLHGRRVCVLGYGPLQDLFPLLDPVGQEIRIGRVAYVVVGAFGPRKSLFGRLADNFIAVPYTAFERDFARKDQGMSAVDMVPADGVSAAQLSEDVRALMRVRRKLRPGERDDFELTSQDQVQEFIARFTGPAGAALLVIASVGLMVGGIGVMAIMLVSVTERTREIGLRMALGARRRDVLWQFLAEAATLTGLGGVVGVPAGLGLARLVHAVLGIPAAAPFAYVAGAVLVSVGVGLACGLYPANRAARLDPVAAMRAE